MTGPMRTFAILLGSVGLMGSVAAPMARAQMKVELVNDVGATAPCVGIGLGMAIVKKCATWEEREGFIRTGDVGVDGKDDGVVTAVAPGSAGAAAGLAVGDRILSVDGKAVRWTPAMEVARQTFGERGKEVMLAVKPAGGGTERDISLVRGDAPMPEGAPKSDSRFLKMTPFMDWRGRFASCMSAGPLGAATVAFCVSHFKPWGYVKAKEVGSVGFAVDPAVATGGAEGALVTSVDAGSATAKAGLSVGDTITEVDGKALTGSVGSLAKERLFGRAGDTRTLVVERGGSQVTEKLVLGSIRSGGE
ncbi:MAG: PDZ domain-containing protein [Acidobacteriota bacterium]|nr:PDZ domain-containing protein [Acidobacteriota bacterium]